MKKSNPDLLTIVLIISIAILYLGGASFLKHKQQKEILDLKKEVLRLEIQILCLKINNDYEN